MNILIKALERLGSESTFRPNTVKRNLALMLKLGVDKQVTLAVARKSYAHIAQLANIRPCRCCYIMLPTGERGALDRSTVEYLVKEQAFFKLAV